MLLCRDYAASITCTYTHSAGCATCMYILTQWVMYLCYSFSAVYCTLVSTGMKCAPKMRYGAGLLVIVQHCTSAHVITNVTVWEHKDSRTTQSLQIRILKLYIKGVWSNGKHCSRHILRKENKAKQELFLKLILHWCDRVHVYDLLILCGNYTAYTCTVIRIIHSTQLGNSIYMFSYAHIVNLSVGYIIYVVSLV